MGGALFHDDGGGAGDEGVASVWGFREIRRWRGERESGSAGAGEVYDLQRRNGEYSLNVMGPQRKKYEPGSVDFFAVLLIPRDDWYIIPFEGDGEDELLAALYSEEQAAEIWGVLGGVGFAEG